MKMREEGEVAGVHHTCSGWVGHPLVVAGGACAPLGGRQCCPWGKRPLWGRGWANCLRSCPRSFEGVHECLAPSWGRFVRRGFSEVCGWGGAGSAVHGGCTKSFFNLSLGGVLPQKGDFSCDLLEWRVFHAQGCQRPPSNQSCKAFKKLLPNHLSTLLLRRSSKNQWRSWAQTSQLNRSPNETPAL